MFCLYWTKSICLAFLRKMRALLKCPPAPSCVVAAGFRGACKCVPAALKHEWKQTVRTYEKDLGLCIVFFFKCQEMTSVEVIMLFNQGWVLTHFMNQFNLIANINLLMQLWIIFWNERPHTCVLNDRFVETHRIYRNSYVWHWDERWKSNEKIEINKKLPFICSFSW